MTDKEIVDKANELARHFYREAGYLVGKGFRFDRSANPQELACWRNACTAFEILNGTDVEAALSNLEDA